MAGEFQELMKQQAAQLEETLNGIFARVAWDSPANKALEQSVRALFQHNDAIVEAVASRLISQVKKCDRHVMPSIVTVCAPKSMAGELAKKGLYPMPGTEAAVDAWHTPLQRAEATVLYEIAFLRCGLRELDCYCHDVFQGRQGGHFLRYRLAPAYGCMSVEKTLQELARFYSLASPEIFSPWARRAVFIDYQDGIRPEKGQSVDLMLERNNLENVLLPDYALYWNVSLERGDQGPDQYSRPEPPDRMCYTAIYENVPGNTFILPSNLHSQPPDLINVSRNGQELRIESPGKCGDSHYKFTVFPVNFAELAASGLEYFVNACDMAIMEAIQRPRTAAEINHLLYAMRNPAFQATYLSDASSGHLLPTYNKRQRYPENVNELFFARGKNRPDVAIAFEGNPLFLADYAAYVINFLQRRYPEYAWRGYGI